jgi:hypothetical protein
MQLACPSCGTRDVRVSRPQGMIQHLKGFCGVSGLRCRRCSSRWETSMWAGGSWKYARCPRCYRQDLTKWTAHRYRPALWTRFLLTIGARARRCPACRCNFASFKPLKEDFSWHHQVRETIPLPPTQETAMVVTEQTPHGEGSGEQMP